VLKGGLLKNSKNPLINSICNDFISDKCKNFTERILKVYTLFFRLRRKNRDSNKSMCGVFLLGGGGLEWIINTEIQSGI
jgi:hypothetical protein